ncbi:ferritin-like domain-containing protein [Pseudoduganella umbonata]|uniref:Ferritin-like domain-containing protein n=1 Tax=Pseudoduganella umbonata TaxID=864828 RepID=A0A4P8HQ59_9BURK|nr:ferritin-like domain-containing protein [Pseudoduganella umbonata]MBB3221525.1 ferritin-like metal-binding protein YciE [Pseudoduganella umbonata]QCP10668.1 ferritin-like domain-containing protein [Pseudoduganella umbonata]
MATKEPRDHLLDWLRDAHAMEQQAETMLKAQAERLVHYGTLKARVLQHLEETHWQKAQLEDCIARLGGSPSVLKDLSMTMMAFGQAAMGMAVDDEVVKNSLQSYVFENMEIASYTVLIAAAEQAGDTATRDVCQQILAQEVAMAKWVLDHLPGTTNAFLTRSAMPGLEAKV